MRQEGGRRLSLVLALVAALMTFVFFIDDFQPESFISDDRHLPAEIAQRIDAWDSDRVPPPTWFQYADEVGLLGPDVPDAVYDAQRNRWFDTHLAPLARQGRYSVEGTREEFLKRTERPEKDKAKLNVSKVVAALGLAALVSSIIGLLCGLTIFGSLRLVAWVIDGFRGPSAR